MPNRLADASSLYLRQHADNPVDWWPWCDEALAFARAQDKPIFLSIGYSSCHWCHVMAHECFEDNEVARALSQYFVAIKLDREERPDIDEVYMAATQMANGHGGWPMSVFLTPGLEPFYAATYIPRGPFLQTVVQLGEAWRRQKDSVMESATEFASAVRSAVTQTASAVPSRSVDELVARAVDAMWAAFDQENGGFGSRPKFPPYCDLLFLLDVQSLVADERVDQMVEATLDAMVRGGLNDHVGGGFHRYSTDERWHLPHFEKILSDNALAAQVLRRAGRESDADAVIGWLDREMKLPHGGYASALDAGAGGVEGRPYVWSWSELHDALGDRLPEVAAAYQLHPNGNYLDEATQKPTGMNVFHRLVDAPVLAPSMESLLEVRKSWPQPARDDKALVAANCLVCLATGDIAFALEVAALLPNLPHQMVEGQPVGDGFLDDYACLALTLASHQESQVANQVVDVMLTRFAAPSGLSNSGSVHNTPLARQVGVFDSAAPSGFATALLVLAMLGRHEEAWTLASPFLHWAERAPMGCATLLRALMRMEGEPLRVTSTPTAGVSLFPTPFALQPDGYHHGVVTVDIPEGHHINSYDPEQDWLVPTSLRIDGAHGEAGFPQGHEPYTGRLEIPVRLMPKGSRRSFEITVRYQLCSETTCFEPTSVTLQGELG